MNKRRQENDGKNKRYVEAEETELPMWTLKSDRGCKQAFRTSFTVDGKQIDMDIDTGAAVSIISEKIFQATFQKVPLQAASIRLKTYTGEVMPVLGQFEATVSFKQQTEQLPVVVVKGSGPALCGKNWLE